MQHWTYSLGADPGHLLRPRDQHQIGDSGYLLGQHRQVRLRHGDEHPQQEGRRQGQYPPPGPAPGPITVPFIMALGVGLASVRNDKNATNDSFGLVAPARWRSAAAGSA